MKPQAAPKILMRRQQTSPQPSFLSNLASAGHRLSGVLSRLSSPAPQQFTMPHNLSSESHGKATSDDLGYGSLMPQVYKENNGKFSGFKAEEEPIVVGENSSAADKIASFLQARGSEISPSTVSKTLSSLKAPLLGALGTAAVAGLVYAAKKLYDNRTNEAHTFESLMDEFSRAAPKYAAEHNAELAEKVKKILESQHSPAEFVGRLGSLRKYIQDAEIQMGGMPRRGTGLIRRGGGISS